MQPSRRQVLGYAATLTAAASLGAPLTALAAVSPPPRLSRAMFQPHLGTQVRFPYRGVVYSGILRSISDLPDGVPGHPHQFCLRITLATAGPPQGTYTFHHAVLGRIPLFVVPFRTARRNYDAVIISAM